MGTLWHEALRWACTIGLFTGEGLQVVICIRHLLIIGSVLLLLLLLSLQQQVALNVNDRSSVLDTKYKHDMWQGLHQMLRIICRWHLVTCWQMISLLQNNKPGHWRDLQPVQLPEHLRQAS